MDYSTIIVAGLALIGTLVGSFLSNSKQSALIAYRLEQLEEKVQKHNNVVERLTVVEKNQKAAFNRIDENREKLEELEKRDAEPRTRKEDVRR